MYFGDRKIGSGIVTATSYVGRPSEYLAKVTSVWAAKGAEVKELTVSMWQLMPTGLTRFTFRHLVFAFFAKMNRNVQFHIE